MTTRPDNLPWRFLWTYVCLWDDDEAPNDKGLRPEDTGEDDGLVENDTGASEPEPDGEEDGDGSEPDLSDEGGDEIDLSEGEFDLEPEDNAPGGFEIVEPEHHPPEIPGFEIIQTDRETTYLREFTSWFDFVNSAASDSLYRWKTKRESHTVGRTDQNLNEWSGTKSFDEAVEMALRRGWPEGRELLSDLLIATRPRPKVYDSLEFEVVGAYPCVPIYCANDPAFMVLDPGASMHAAKPIVRIDYNHWINNTISAKSMMIKGAAIVSLADTLERQGFSTELRIIGNSKEPYGQKVFRYSIPFKSAGEPLDIDRAAFAIAHPAAMRRLAFAILEQHADLEADFKYGYGTCPQQPNDTKIDSLNKPIFITGAQANETADSAKAAVLKAAQAFLNEKDIAA